MSPYVFFTCQFLLLHRVTVPQKVLLSSLFEDLEKTNHRDKNVFYRVLFYIGPQTQVSEAQRRLIEPRSPSAPCFPAL